VILPDSLKKVITMLVALLLLFVSIAVLAIWHMRSDYEADQILDLYFDNQEVYSPGYWSRKA